MLNQPNKKPAGNNGGSKMKHSHQELELLRQQAHQGLLIRQCQSITAQEDKLAELQYALSTLAGGENHAALNLLKETINKYEDTIDKMRENVIRNGVTPPPKREYENGKPLIKTIDHANEADRKRKIQKREFKNKRREEGR